MKCKKCEGTGLISVEGEDGVPITVECPDCCEPYGVTEY